MTDRILIGIDAGSVNVGYCVMLAGPKLIELLRSEEHGTLREIPAALEPPPVILAIGCSEPRTVCVRVGRTLELLTGAADMQVWIGYERVQRFAKVCRAEGEIIGHLRGWRDGRGERPPNEVPVSVATLAKQVCSGKMGRSARNALKIELARRLVPEAPTHLDHDLKVHEADAVLLALIAGS